MKKILTLFLLGSILLSCTPRQQEKMYVIHVEFEGIRYDSLELVLWLDEWNRETVKGHSKDGYTWTFSYPRSFHERLYYAWLRVLGTPDSVRHEIGVFNFIQQSDTLRVFGFIPERIESFIKLRYIETDTLFNQRRVCTETDNTIFITSIVDEFEIFTTDQEVITTIKAMYGSYFILWHETLSYEGIVQRQAEFIRQHPNSQIMINSLYGNMAGYKSTDDIAKLFNLFTPELQQSFYGRKIYRHLTRDMTFINQKLPTWDTDELEWIIQDSSAFNLVLFSASWCAPCIRQIPLLKEIYRDLGHKIIMTYISIDHEQTAEAWREKMREHNIPWRSLMVLTREKDRTVREKYSVQGVPDAFLVHPHSMEKERIVLWEEAHVQRLYDLVK